MSKDTRYRTLKELGKSVAKGCADLERGKLNLEDIKKLLDDVREIEERTIILNYKGIEKLTKGESVAEPVVIKPKAKPKEESGSLMFRFEPIEPIQEVVDEASEPDNQISLIDSINELSDEEKEEASAKATLKEEATDRVKEKKVVVESKPAVEEKKLVKKSEKKASINEVIKKNSKPTLAQALSQKPIKEINKALSVNARLGIVKELFKGDSDSFHVFIKGLEGSGGREEADRSLTESIATQEWTEDSDSIKRLRNLIQRRFVQ